jgi:hypothetical protein
MALHLGCRFLADGIRRHLLPVYVSCARFVSLSELAFNYISAMPMRRSTAISAGLKRQR